jgi:hypothetical protein
MENQEIFKKIRLSADLSALVVNSPQEYLKMILQAKADYQPAKTKLGKYDFVQIYGSNRIESENLVKEYSGSGKYDCLFWICYPKGGGKIKSDLTRNIVWSIANTIGMQCVSQVAIDETRPALRCRLIEKVGK